jgi:hypothetical protein
MDLTESGLVQLARSFYPTDYPVTADDYSQDVLPFQRTPEYARWSEAWNKAMVWPEWKTLVQEMHRAFAVCGDCTQPRGAACRRCCVYLERPLPDGARHLTYVAAAASVLAPLYVVYCTTSIVVDRHSLDRRLSFELPEEANPHAATLAALVERILGYQRFPLQFANVPLPGVRVAHSFGEEATLLDALFDNHLESVF